MFHPYDTIEHPCDVTLVVEDDKEFKAHKDVLSKASLFFEKLLNSDMKESKEGVVQLEMFSESVMAATLEFIYTGHVQEVLTQERAQDLTVIADYLILPSLKSTAEQILLQKCHVSNCILTYNFAEFYQCERLLCKARQLTLANFMFVSNTEGFLNLSNKEVEMWISSDEIEVSTEEDVFEVILAWIDHDKSNRRKYFYELFRHVRLPYVTLDYLRSDVVTNDLVKDNEVCLDLVEDAMFLIDSKNYQGLSVRPRKSLETTVIVVSTTHHKSSPSMSILGYFPREDTWCWLGEDFSDGRGQVPCYGKLYRTGTKPSEGLLCYDPLSNTWTTLPCMDHKSFRQLFVSKEGEMYALMSHILDRTEKDKTDIPLYITKYKPESNSWEDPSMLKHIAGFSSREGMCILAKGSFIYFIGGRSKVCRRRQPKALKDVYKYDITKGNAERLADLRIARDSASGAWAHGRIFVAGGFNNEAVMSNRGEFYDEKTKEWQLIAAFNMHRHRFPSILSANDKLYVFVSLAWHGIGRDSSETKIECYDPVMDEWNEATEIPIRVNTIVLVNACSLKVFKGLLTQGSLAAPSSSLTTYVDQTKI